MKDLSLNHVASEQSFGYRYQDIFALNKSLEKLTEITDFRVFIEHLDDVDFQEEKGQSLNQLKHKNKKHDLAWYSPDFWKTVGIWLKFFDINSPDAYDFYLITTQKIKVNDPLQYLTFTHKNIDKAISALNKKTSRYKNVDKSISAPNKKKKDKGNKEHIKQFDRLSADEKRIFLDKIIILDNSKDIHGFMDEINEKLRPFVQEDSQIEDISERLIGWWEKKIIENKNGISKEELLNKLRKLSIQYSPLDLPEYSDDCIWDESPNYNNFTFVKQLKLLGYKSSLNNAITDFHKASFHRSQWISKQVIGPSVLKKYDLDLYNEWERLYNLMKDESDENIDEYLQKGRDLYNHIMSLNLYPKPRFTRPYFMRGSYHSLSDKKKVGWHLKYKELLNDDGND